MFEHMTTAERIQTAKKKTERVLDHLLYLLALHENNAIIVYSDTLSSQIRYLHAANAFDVFRAGLHQFEIVRLCALWDPAGDDKENIPTIIKLIDRPEVIEALAHETLAHWSGHDEEFGQEQAQKARDEGFTESLVSMTGIDRRIKRSRVEIGDAILPLPNYAGPAFGPGKLEWNRGVDRHPRFGLHGSTVPLAPRVPPR
jgi:HEPN superfamily AbiU2-like protein